MNFKIDWLDFSDPSYFIKEYEVDPSWINDFGDDYHAYRNRWINATGNNHFYDFPLCLEVESSYYCNFRCPNCPRFASTVPKKGNMSLDIFKEILKECKEMKLDSIFLDHGGEALMNEHLLEFVRLSSEAHIYDIMLSTNVSLLTRNISRGLIMNGLTKINFSIDAATPESYLITRQGGYYEKTLQNIEDFLEEKYRSGKSYPRVRVSFIVQDCNREEMEIFYEQWKDKVNIITFQTMKNYNIILNDNSLKPSKQARNFKCSQIFSTLMIDHKGGIHLCNHDYNHKYTLGTIGKNSIKECWNSVLMRNLRDIHRAGRWYTFNFCKNCVLGCI